METRHAHYLQKNFGAATGAVCGVCIQAGMACKMCSEFSMFRGIDPEKALNPLQAAFISDNLKKDGDCPNCGKKINVSKWSLQVGDYPIKVLARGCDYCHYTDTISV